MFKKASIIILLSILLLLTACSTKNTLDKVGTIDIAAISSSIGAVGENTNNFDTQSFKFTITLTNNDTTDINIVSVKPILSEKFLERVSNKDTLIEVNRTVSQGGNLEVNGEIIFDAKGLTKDQIFNLQPFVKEIKITDERIINKSF